jgi:hypothetical protein
MVSDSPCDTFMTLHDGLGICKCWERQEIERRSIKGTKKLLWLPHKSLYAPIRLDLGFDRSAVLFNFLQFIADIALRGHVLELAAALLNLPCLFFNAAAGHLAHLPVFSGIVCENVRRIIGFGQAGKNRFSDFFRMVKGDEQPKEGDW